MNIRRIAACLTASALGLAGALATSTPADARAVGSTADSDPVGKISGAYAPSPDRNYWGRSQPARANQCTHVERKDQYGWTRHGVYQYDNCDENYYKYWDITNDDLVANTYAIRIRVVSGDNAPNSYRVLCVSKTDCLKMRYGTQD